MSFSAGFFMNINEMPGQPPKPIPAVSRRMTRRQFVAALAGTGGLLLNSCFGGPASGPSNLFTGTTISSGGANDWVAADPMGFIASSYPANQQWGVVYVLLVDARTGYSPEQTCDFSRYRFLNLDVKGAVGGEEFGVGVTAAGESKDVPGPRYQVSNLTTDWQLVQIPLTNLVHFPHFPLSRFRQLRSACELYFSGAKAQTVCFRSIRYTS